MKLLLAFCLLVALEANVVPGQIPGGTSAREIPTEVQKSDTRVNEVIERANGHFRKGKLDLEDNKREQARNEFDKSVDEILMSGLDVRASQRLQIFYLELVEKIYREEVAKFPPPPLPERIKNPLSLKDLYLPNAEPRNGELVKVCRNDLFERASIRGLRLRMTVSQVRSLLPSLQLPRPDALGSSEVTLHAPFPAVMNGLLGITLSFLDSKLFRIAARYDNVKSWDSPRQFIFHISDIFGLPIDWDRLPSQHSYNEDELLERLECSDSDIVAGIYVSDYGDKYPVVMLTDISSTSDLQKRSQKRLKEISDAIERLRSEDRKRFKP
jgi:hypothetical protein